MSTFSREAINTSSDDELFSLLGEELERRTSVPRSSPAFSAEIQDLPVGLKAMAATYELDVSLTMDDLGWHFGNWHDPALAEETARGLEELGALELAQVFKEAYQIAMRYWSELGSENWSQWYHGSPLEKAVEPLTDKAWSILEGKKNGIFEYWVDYARRYPERVGANA
jgi:hypothetical protein